MAKLAMSLLLALLGVAPAYGDAPYDLWWPERLEKIRDPKTLNLQVIVRGTYLRCLGFEVGDAKWASSGSPVHAVHTRRNHPHHGYLAIPPAGPARPALIVGHGHGGQADLATSQLIAASGYARCRFPAREPDCLPAVQTTPSRRGFPWKRSPTSRHLK